MFSSHQFNHIISENRKIIVNHIIKSHTFQNAQQMLGISSTLKQTNVIGHTQTLEMENKTEGRKSRCYETQEDIYHYAF